jgi:hypothetical protein
MNRILGHALRVIAVLSVALTVAAHAEPYLALAQGLQCNVCHVNPTGGGLRTALGVAFAQRVLPAQSLPQSTPDWSGSVGESVRLGGDLRESWSRTQVPHQATQQGWSLDQLRLYSDIAVIPGRLSLAVDEALAPGNAATQEAYVRYSDPEAGWYAKAGKFYLPFGWRLQDNTAFVREVSTISMATPDNGIELGLQRPEWSAQLDLSNGAANAGANGSGHQLTGQAVWVQPAGRLGAALALTQSPPGNRRVAAVFGGLRTGPLVWLGEVDGVQDDSLPGGRRSQVATLAELDWAAARGHNLKLTYEYFDPDRAVANDQQVRYSLVYEFTPIPFVQIRAGARRYDGIPQNDLQNRRLIFIEVHGVF